MKKILPILALTMFAACQTPKDAELYHSPAFQVYADKVVQGGNQAVALSPTHLTSNYQSPANQAYSPLIEFKFSINYKDNELPVGVNHRLLIAPENGAFVAPVITFGQPFKGNEVAETGFLPANTKLTLRLDFRPVLQQFKEKGFYQTYQGQQIAAADFKGVYVAGGSEPLTWDFVNLGNFPDLQMKDPDGDGIYETTLVMNAYNADNFTSQEWKPQRDLSKFPQLQSDQVLLDALYNMALDETSLNIEADKTFRTGEKWPGVWTRDISYSVLLAYAFLEPEVSKNSLMRKVKRDRIIQDTGSGGAWPVSTDRTTWALAAWEIYLATGDEAWLKQAFQIIKNSVDDDLKVAYDTENGLFKGESSFLDWREQTYPRWMSNMDIYVSENLGTNVVHYQTYRILTEMAKLLNEDAAAYKMVAERLKESINSSFWLEEKGYYGQYRYGKHYLSLSPKFEGLGASLAMLFGVADSVKQQKILSQSPITPFGVSCIYPQIAGMPPYHNDGVWPFVQAFWNWSAAKAGHEQALNAGLAGLYRSAALFLTNKENFVAETGDFKGTQINSNRQLWSVAGNLAMTYRVFFGMNFEQAGIRFAPAIPKAYEGKRTLTNFRYRKSDLSISVHGFGNEIASITLDGQELPNALFPSNLEGAHTVVIEMANHSFDKGRINSVPNVFSVETPLVALSDRTLTWKPVKGAKKYKVYKNRATQTEVTDTAFVANADGQYQVIAVDLAGYESFASEPLWLTAAPLIVEVEQFSKEKSAMKLAGYSGKGFVEISKTANTVIEMEITVPKMGMYVLDVRYANGSGPWNTDNKCALRSLSVNNVYMGAWVFPQRGKDEWSDWGFSNGRTVILKEGKNTLKISFEPWNENMNGEVNTAVLDYLRVIPL